MVSRSIRRLTYVDIVRDLSELGIDDVYNIDEAEKRHVWDIVCHTNRRAAIDIIRDMAKTVQEFKLDIKELTERIKSIDAKGDKAEQKDLYEGQVYMTKLFSERYLGEEYKDTWFNMNDEQVWGAILTVLRKRNIFFRIRYLNTNLWITPTNDGNISWQDMSIKRCEKIANNSRERNSEYYFAIQSNKSKAEHRADISRLRSSNENLLLGVQLNNRKITAILEFIEEEEKIGTGEGKPNLIGDGSNEQPSEDKEENGLIRIVPVKNMKGFVDIRDAFKNRSVI